MATETNSKGALGSVDVFLGLICSILFVDVIASNSATGVPVLTWWLIIAIIFYIPNAFVTAELAVSYPDRGGIYSWIARAFGGRWAARTSYLYFVNNAIWVSSAFIWFSGFFSNIFFPDMPFFWQVIIGVVLTWLVVWVASKPLSESKVVINLAAVAKVLAFAMIIFGGFVWLARGNMPANPFTVAALIPTVNDGLMYLPVVVYCCCGMEVLCASANEMRNPKKDLPRSIFGVVGINLVFNILACFAVLVTIPVDQIDTITGITDVIRVAFGANPILIVGFGILVLYGIFAQIVSWGLSGCIGASEAAQSGELPAVFGKERNGSPVGALVITGIIATVIFLVYGAIASNSSDLFYTLLAFSSIIFFFPYILMDAAYLKLRAVDRDMVRTFKAPAGRLLASVCMLVLVFACILFVWVPGQPFDAGYAMPIIIGVIVVVAIGEAVVGACVRKMGKNSAVEQGE